MVYRRLSQLAFLVLVTALSVRTASGSKDEIDLNALSDADLKSVSLRFERTGCYGTCPAYSVMLHGDGKVEYVGKNNVKVKGSQHGQVEVEKIKILLSEFARAKFLLVEDVYSQEKCKGRVCTDMPTVITELIVKGASHSVRHYYGCGSAPKALFDVESAVDKTVDAGQWTGDTSKQGPFGTTCWNQ